MDDRIAQVCRWTEGPTVLDLGAVQPDGDGVDSATWLHGQLADRYARVIGVDTDRAGVEAARQHGYTMVHADATDLDLAVRADTVVAGELLEHVSDPGGLLDAAHAHLVPDGQLILTTPNPWACAYLRRLVRGEASINGEHVAWYGPTVLRQLLARHGFAIRQLRSTRRPHRGLQRIAQWLDSDLFGGSTWCCLAEREARS